MYRDIVVCVTESDGRDNTIKAAAAFANQHGSNLIGLYVTLGEDSPVIPPFGAVSADLIEEAITRQQERLNKAKESFIEITGSMECSATWLAVDEEAHPLRAVIYSDLVITNQAAYDPRRGVSNIGFINSLVLETGKPVLLIPTGWHEPDLGSKIVLGWDESREAVRAVQDALPLLKLADQVDVVSINYEGEDDVVDVSEITSYLKERNVSNDFHLKVTDEHLDTPEKVLINYCEVNDADLLVIGGYGHTRLREIILGGVTRHMVKNSDIPILLSH
ncbi:MAG: universal stress protein [Arenicella sp.]|nr:universal stress protein [Arenicella sp.]